MKHKVSELDGALLDAAVAKAEGGDPARLDVTQIGDRESRWAHVPVGTPGASSFRPSSAWEDGGPIIERERLLVGPRAIGGWAAWQSTGGALTRQGTRASGPTALIAAMRTYVASKLGDEIDL